MKTNWSLIVPQLLNKHGAEIQRLRGLPDMRTGSDDDRRDLEDEIDRHSAATRLLKSLMEKHEKMISSKDVQEKSDLFISMDELRNRYLSSYGADFHELSKNLRP